ncbi:MAG: HD domain-containing protein [Gammaproteobacteria bacterium]
MEPGKIGSLAWLEETNGKLTLRSRLALLSRILAPSMAGLFKTFFRWGRNEHLRLEDIPMPDSAAVKRALEEIESCAIDSVVQHSFRTYLWGAGLGQIEKLGYDPEFLLLGCLLHDLGMTERHRRDACHCFAGDSAIAAAATMREVGWGEEQTSALANIICLHMNGHIGLADGHEAHLLQQGAACDIVGSRYYDFHRDYRQAVLQKHPRDDLNKVFEAYMANERMMRPASRAALMYRMGLPLMIRVNPYTE